jgi:hypothetical protein
MKPILPRTIMLIRSVSHSRPKSRPMACGSLVAVTMALFSFTASAKDPGAEESTRGGDVSPHAEAVFTTHAPKVDGVWSEGEWAEAKPIFFPALAGNVDAAQRPPCEVRFLWTAEGVYAGFRTTDTTPVFGHFTPGEPLYQEDVFEMFIDQVGDHRQFYEIQSDPAGQLYFRNNLLTAPPRVTAKKRLTPEFCSSELWRYDLPKPDGFLVASKLEPKTNVWTVEVFLPASFVNRRGGGGPMKPCAWRVNLVRHDWDSPKSEPKRKSKFMYWAPVSPGMPHISPTAMGELKFVKP